MEEIKIVPLNLQTDIEKIEEWKTIFKHHDGYKAIEHFILEDNTYYTLSEVIKINYETYPIGDNEQKHALAIKNKSNDLLGFVIATVMDKKTTEPSMFLQYIVLSPEYQGHGYGKKVLQELTLNSEQYFGVPIREYFCMVHRDNYLSMNLLLNDGATLKNLPSTCYYQAIKKLPKLELDKE